MFPRLVLLKVKLGPDMILVRKNKGALGAGGNNLDANQVAKKENKGFSIACMLKIVVIPYLKVLNRRKRNSISKIYK
jgi:hypothetical protein